MKPTTPIEWKEKDMDRKWVRGLWAFAALYLVLFLGHWALHYRSAWRAAEEMPVPAAPGGGGDKAFHNYAKDLIPGQPASQAAIYEKVAALAARTRDFDGDEKKVRDLIHSNGVLVQQEEKSGEKDDRLLSLTLGVAPDKFDAVTGELRRIGELVSFQLTKTDKTHDYQSLVADRASLEAHMAELTALKGASGKMEDLLNLQDKIFDLEKQIQDMGIQINQYEGATGLCTVLLTLKEKGPLPSPWWLGLWAFQWTANACLGLLPWFFFGSFILVLAWGLVMVPRAGKKQDRKSFFYMPPKPRSRRK